MSLSLAERVEPLFLHAVDLDADEQASFVEQSCSGDPELKQELRSLLRADAEIRQTWSGLVPEPAPDLSLSIPKIPGYHLRQPLGQGGMGSVYSAIGQEPPFDGVCFAVKVLHAHRSTPQGRRRFAAEQQALAKLDHRFIARLYGSGELADGRPYLIMEHIEGLSLDRYCRRQRLSLEQRLSLFCDICSAVHYAHQNLIVHRDLKPSNILVSDDGLPHLLDFGIAKRLQTESPTPDSPSFDPLTRWMAPLTPAFASPEQLAGDEITTASDIYSLGRLLLYLLTDCLPDLGHPPREVSPSFLASLVEQKNQQRMAWQRRTEPRKLIRQLAGDLGYITAKALRPAAGERYASAQELSDDISRYLAGNPVTARKGTWRYYLTKYCRRRRVALWGVASTLLALALAIVGWQQTRHVQVLEQRGEASMSLLKESVGLPEELFLENDAVESTISEVLALQLPEPDRNLLIEGTKRLYKPDSEILQQVQRYIHRSAGDVDTLAPETIRGLASVSLRFGRLLNSKGRFEQAGEVLRDSLTLAEAAKLPGTKLAGHLEGLSEALHSREHFAEATELVRRALELRRAAAGQEGVAQLLPGLSHLGSLLYAQGFYQASEEAHREALDLIDPQDTDLAPRRSALLSGLAVAMMETGRFEAAEEAVQIQTETRGPRHVTTLQMRHNLVATLGRAGKLDEAIEIAAANLEIAEQVMGKNHPRLAHIVLSLAASHDLQGRPDQCAKYARRAVDLRRAAFADGHSQTAYAASRLGICLAQLGDFSEAQELLESSLRDMQRAADPNQGWIEETRQRLQRLHRLQGE